MAIRDVLAQLRPDDGILGEEFGRKAGTTGLTWILDPIDGTRGFVAGTPNWGTLISVERDGQPLLGQIDQPYIGERFVGSADIAQVTGPAGKARFPPWTCRPQGGRNAVQKARKPGLRWAKSDRRTALRRLPDAPHRAARRALPDEPIWRHQTLPRRDEAI